jgi:peptide/nickel transport system permease protein
MARYIVRRLLWMVVLLVLVSALTFVIFYLLPAGDPAQLRAGPRATPATIEAVREQLHLNDSKLTQFGHYMGRVFLHFDLGKSFENNTSVLGEIRSRLPATISLAVGAAIVWLLIAFPVGIVSAVKRRSVFDRMAMGTSLVAVSAPVYWLGLIFLYLFAQDVGKFKSLIMPWIVLAASFAAIYARLLRGSLLDVMSEDYIRTARAKGLSERRVVVKHGVRSAVTPVVTVLGVDLGILLGGAVLTETVFNIPGIGRLSYDAIQTRDLPTVQGVVLFAAFFVIVMNLIVDLVYAFLDPRVTYS